MSRTKTLARRFFLFQTGNGRDVPRFGSGRPGIRKKMQENFGLTCRSLEFLQLQSNRNGCKGSKRHQTESPSQPPPPLLAYSGQSGQNTGTDFLALGLGVLYLPTPHALKQKLRPIDREHTQGSCYILKGFLERSVRGVSEGS